MKRKAKDTLTAIEMNLGETEEFELVNGKVVRLELLATSAKIIKTTLKEL